MYLIIYLQQYIAKRSYVKSVGNARARRRTSNVRHETAAMVRLLYYY